MDRRKPTLKLDPEDKREVEWQKKTSPAFSSGTDTKNPPSIIRLPATAEQLAARPKPQLAQKPSEVAKELPFKITSAPLPAPRPDAFPQAKFPERVEEEHFLNKEAPMSDEEKLKYIFVTNYLATYGETNAAEIEAAYAEHRATQSFAKRISKNHDERAQRFRAVIEIPLWLHVILIGSMLTIFAFLRMQADF